MTSIDLWSRILSGVNIQVSRNLNLCIFCRLYPADTQTDTSELRIVQGFMENSSGTQWYTLNVKYVML